MRLLYARDSWFYRMGFDLMIDFCVWVLEMDGLQVIPFDQHPDGDGSLRAAGMTAEDWQVWFLQMIRQREEFQQALQRRAPTDPLNLPADRTTRPFPEFRPPASAWKGNNSVSERLNALWEQYGPLSNGRKMREPELAMSLMKEERSSHKRLYDALRPYHKRLPPLSIYLVGYEQPLDYLVPPATLVMTLQEGQPEPAEFRERVLAATAELATPPGQRSKTALFTRGRNAIGQFIPTYRVHVRKPPPPALPRPEIPRLADPLKQMVADALSDDRMVYGTVDLTTLQFLREKQRPDWQLYEVQFQEMDGERHRGVFIFHRQEDGSWHQSSGSTWDDAHEPLTNIFAPIHDHPLLLLSVSTGGDARHQHYFLAYGDVIDNGFHVERVRLATKSGQLLEDRIEQGLVFFAVEQDQPISLPMQAELYDAEGRLVWGQTVPDSGLPPWLRARWRF